MNREEYIKISKEIESLPKGGITYKRINGTDYAYYQWRENGKQRSRRAKDDELEKLTIQIERRKMLQDLIKRADVYKDAAGYEYRGMVRLGRELEQFAEPVKEWKKRECYDDLHEYVHGDTIDKVFILYGLRRTGKTTLIRQAILDMDDEMREKAMFIQINGCNSLADLNRDLLHAEKDGYRYVFIDEVTMLDDFIEGAALFSDVFAASGMKIVLSGTDSLGFMFAEDRQLYDRCIMCHTTFIPYREFENVLGIAGIDEYVEYGGTMSVGGRIYNGTFSDDRRTGEYVDSAIAVNIQHSLKNYQYEGHFRSLRELYDRDELTSAINRVVEDMNHKFTMEVLTRDFRSSDLSISARNLRSDRERPTDILDRIDIDSVTGELKRLLEIRNRNEQTIGIEECHRIELKEYFDLLDLTSDIEKRWMTDYSRKELVTAFSQPGLRYSQAEALIKSLMKDEAFRNVEFAERKRIQERILLEVKGRMMEDIILLETKESRKECEVFRLQFAMGEYDMVVHDPEEGYCEIYKIKHSDKMVSEQYRYLADETKCKNVEFRYGRIRKKAVIYRGVSGAADGMEYINAEEYLKTLTS